MVVLRRPDTFLSDGQPGLASSPFCAFLWRKKKREKGPLGCGVVLRRSQAKKVRKKKEDRKK